MKKQIENACHLSKIREGKAITAATAAALAFFLLVPSLLQIFAFGRDFGGATCTAQSTWNQKADFGGIERQNAVGFSIGQKGYIGTGKAFSNMPPYQDFWEWDKATNVWTQKADFAGSARAFAVGFSIGAKGYIGTGWDGVFGYYHQDFWEWDQATNTWAKKGNFPPSARYDAVGFSIGAKGYIGTGYLPFATYQDFWEWDQATNSWTQKANFPGGDRYRAVGFSIGAKGYIGTGNDGLALVSSFKKDFWEWDQANNTWTQKADFAGVAREDAVGFSMLTTYGAGGFVGTGSDLNNTTLKDFWEWNPGTNTWIQRASFGAGPRKWAVGFSIDSMGYIGTGTEHFPNNSKITHDDFWEFCLTCPPPCVLSGNISSSATTLCIGSNATISASGGTGYAWNTGAATPSIVVSPSVNTSYTVIVSDASGCKDTVSINVPVKNCCSVTPAINSDPAPNTTFCVGQNVYLAASGGTSYVWSTGETGANIAATLSVTTTYSVTVTDANGCTGTSSTTFTVDPNCTTTGISQFYSNILKADIWPNPSGGEFWLSIPSGQITGYKVQITDFEIYNVMGEKITQLQLLPKGGSGWVIDLSSQPDGIYFLQVKTGQGTATQKLIIYK